MTAALIKRVLYLIATVSAVAFVYLTAYLPEGVWLLTALLLLLNISLDLRLYKRALIIAATGLASMALIFIGTLIAPFVIAQIIIHSIVTGYCVYLGALRGKAAYPWFVVNFMGVMSINTDGTLAAAIGHSEATLISMAIVFLAQIILLPFYKRDEYRSSLIKLIRELDGLVDDIFNCLLASEYPDNIYLFERRIHKQKIKCLNGLALLAEREAAAQPDAHRTADMQALFEIIIDIGQIRRRVTDHTIFALCHDELLDLQRAISSTLAAFILESAADQEASSLDALYQSIMNFENSFEHILRVTAREPLVFALMIGALQALLHQCKHIAGYADESEDVAA